MGAVLKLIAAACIGIIALAVMAIPQLTGVAIIIGIILGLGYTILGAFGK